eukprot:COSAG04_NODE_935_length_9335_cov_46.007687_13_plen_72_part_01
MSSLRKETEEYEQQRKHLFGNLQRSLDLPDPAPAPPSALPAEDGAPDPHAKLTSKPLTPPPPPPPAPPPPPP